MMPPFHAQMTDSTKLEGAYQKTEVALICGSQMITI